MMKNGILTFLFAFCPGAGQMYQGYMKRGLSLITMFCVAFGAGTLLEVLYVAMPIVWMYSFFDTFNLRAQIGAGTAPQDDYLVHINWHDQRMEQFMLDSHKLLGWGLIALGALVAYQNILMNTLGGYRVALGPEQPFLPCTLPDDGSAARGGGVRGPVICGAWLVRGPQGAEKQKPQNDAEDADFTRVYCTGCAGRAGSKGFAMPKLSALLGKSVTPDDETEDADDGRDEK